MLQDFSLDPLTVRQVHTVNGLTSGRWTWLLSHGVANIYNVPIYNFSGWMLIMLYASAFTFLVDGGSDAPGISRWSVPFIHSWQLSWLC